jgi:hypothetical protein
MLVTSFAVFALSTSSWLKIQEPSTGASFAFPLQPKVSSYVGPKTHVAVHRYLQISDGCGYEISCSPYPADKQSSIKAFLATEPFGPKAEQVLRTTMESLESANHGTLVKTTFGIKQGWPGRLDSFRTPDGSFVISEIVITDHGMLMAGVTRSNKWPEDESKAFFGQIKLPIKP